MTVTNIKFGGGLPDPAYLPKIWDLFEAVVRDEADSLGYDQAHLSGGGVWGYEPLRAAIAGRLGSRSGAALDANNVVVTNGASGALELVASSLVGPGTVVAVEELTYPSAVKILRERGATIVPVPIDADGLRVDILRKELETHGPASPTVLYTISTAQSPTGTNLSPARRTELASLAATTGLTIVQDDTYGEVEFGHQPPGPLIGMAPNRTVHVGSFSKTLAPGLRLGWIAASQDFCQVVARQRTDLGQTMVVQHVVARMFDEERFEPHLAAVTDCYRQKRNALMEALERYCGDTLKWNQPESGFFLWATLAAGDVRAVERYGADEGVSFLGGPHFSVGEPNLNGIRLAYSELPAGTLEEGVRRLGRAIESAQAEAASTRRAQ